MCVWNISSLSTMDCEKFQIYTYLNSLVGHIQYTRVDQNVLQFSMMYKWHRKNNYIIFQRNLPVHQYTSDICQKVLLIQSNSIPGACCRDTTPWPATSHHHQKTSFREGAASDVEIGRSRWVSGRVSKVGETAALI